MSASASDPDLGLRPKVAPARRPGQSLIIALAAIASGVLAFIWMAQHRAPSPRGSAGRPLHAAEAIAIPPIPREVQAMSLAARQPPPVLLPSAPPSLPPVAAAPATAPTTAAQTGRTPVLVVDYSATSSLQPPPSSPIPAGVRHEATDAAGLGADERFAARVGGGQGPAQARATMLRDQANLIPQGATVPAVLETALDSDLPGYARAVVSRDVRGFDASRVLIPRGSRVIGEYRSAVSQGQTRAFVIWTRIIRPDGGSIMIGSGGGDTLGRAGLAGSVDTHFFERFSGAILLTVLNAGASAAATAASGVPSTEVVIGSTAAGAVGGVTAPLSALTPTDIPPTIKVAQGTPLLIFVQRDLDFSDVEAAK